jgi:hypothetical protein
MLRSGAPVMIPAWTLVLIFFTGAASAAEPVTIDEPKWSFEATAYPTHVRGGERYTSGIMSADRGPLHLEARVNYESVGTRSAYVGWTFSGGESLSWEITPILGVAWGDIRALVPGVEWSLAWGPFDFYSEAQWVNDRASHNDSYIYSWNELGYRATDWLRLGVAGQRTRVYGGDRDLQRGPFVQLSMGRVTLGGYWFNPGSSDQVFVGSIGVAF